jgi:hypothetical protein
MLSSSLVVSSCLDAFDNPVHDLKAILVQLFQHLHYHHTPLQQQNFWHLGVSLVADVLVQRPIRLLLKFHSDNLHKSNRKGQIFLVNVNQYEIKCPLCFQSAVEGKMWTVLAQIHCLPSLASCATCLEKLHLRPLCRLQRALEAFDTKSTISVVAALEDSSSTSSISSSCCNLVWSIPARLCFNIFVSSDQFMILVIC